MEQYPIPQFIEKEGKIIFFLTFRQFFLFIGGGLVCIAFYYLLPFILFVIFSILIIILVAIVAFLKIDNESVVKVLLNFIMYSTRSKNYTWKKKESPYPFKIEPLGGKEELIVEQKTQSIEKPFVNPKAGRLQDIKKMIEIKK